MDLREEVPGGGGECVGVYAVPDFEGEIEDGEGMPLEGCCEGL